MDSRCVPFSKHLHFTLPVVKNYRQCKQQCSKIYTLSLCALFWEKSVPLPQTIAQYTLLLVNLALIPVLFSRQKRWCHHLLLQPAYKLHSCWYRHFESEAYSLALILPSLRAGYTKYQPNQINILWHLLLLQQCENQAPLCSDANELFSFSSLAQAVSRG